MSTFLDLAKRRRSVRAYLNQSVEPEQLEYILHCAQLAPSAVNKQPWRILVAESQRALEAVRQTYPKPWFATAPVVLVAVAQHDEAWHRPCDGKDHADIDLAILAEHIVLAAADAGLASCWVCNFDAPLLHRLLGLHPQQEPVALLPIGHPDPEGELRPASRKTIGEIVTHI